MPVVLDCVILFSRTRQENLWRLIYLDSAPKSKRASVLEIPAYLARHHGRRRHLVGYGRSRVFGRSCWPLSWRPMLLVARISSPNQAVSSLILLPLLAEISDQVRPRW